MHSERKIVTQCSDANRIEAASNGMQTCPEQPMRTSYSITSSAAASSVPDTHSSIRVSQVEERGCRAAARVELLLEP